MFIIICIYDDKNTKIYNPVPTIQLKIKDSTNFIESLCVPSQQILPSTPNKEVTTVKNYTYYSVLFIEIMLIDPSLIIWLYMFLKFIETVSL